MPRFSNRGSDWRASKHRKESMKNRIREEDVSARAKILVSAGLKSHREDLLPHEEKGKCDAAKHGAEFPSIGNHSPEQQVNQKWPYRNVTPPVTAET